MSASFALPRAAMQAARDRVGASKRTRCPFACSYLDCGLVSETPEVRVNEVAYTPKEGTSPLGKVAFFIPDQLSCLRIPRFSLKRQRLESLRDGGEVLDEAVTPMRVLEKEKRWKGSPQFHDMSENRDDWLTCCEKPPRAHARQ